MARGKINKPLSTRGWKYSVLPSLRPPTLSRVVCCLWSTVLYSERPSYRHLYVSPLWLCGSAESDLINSLGKELCSPRRYSWVLVIPHHSLSFLTHILYHIEREKSSGNIAQTFTHLFVQVVGSAPGRPLVKFLTTPPKKKKTIFLSP